MSALGSPPPSKLTRSTPPTASFITAAITHRMSALGSHPQPSKFTRNILRTLNITPPTISLATTRPSIADSN
jgi:hypothetical protein